MKSFKILLMAVLTILSVSVFAQAPTKNQAKVSNQKSEKAKFTCPMHPDMVMDKLGMCPKSGTTLNLSLNDKMVCCFGCISTLNLSTKEKMKMEVMKI